MTNLDILIAGKIAQRTTALFNKSKDQPKEKVEDLVLNWAGNVKQLKQEFGKSGPIELVQSQFQLQPDMLAILCMSALPAVDSRYSDFYLRINYGPVQTLPTIESLLSIVSGTYEDMSELQGRLQNDSPLLFWKLLKLDPASDFLRSTLTPTQDFINLLNEDSSQDEAVNGLFSLVDKTDLDLPADKVELLPDCKLITIQGAFRERQLSYALKLAKAYGQELYELNTKVLLAREDRAEALRKVLLAIALKNGILYWQDSMEELGAYPECIPLINAWLRLARCRLLAGEHSFVAQPHALEVQANTIDLLPLNRHQDEEVWQSMANTYIPDTNVDWKTINNTYYMHFPRLKECFALLKQKKQEGASIDTDTVYEVYQNTSPQHLAQLAQLDQARFSFDEMSLTPEVQQKMEALVAAFNKRVLLNAQQTSGVCGVFEGPTGTGKTMAAEALANELHLPLYRINYAQLADTMGEVETSITNLFRLAEINSAALLFDDADILFDKADSQQGERLKMINGFLVQKIQEFGSLLLLTTNKKEKIDPAFFRKATTQVAFKALNAKQRLQVLRQVLNNYGVKVAPGVKLENLAVYLQMSGNTINRLIKNAILSASAGKDSLEDVVVKAEDLAKAIKLEQS